MEKKWDTVTPADLKRLFVSGTYMSHWSRKGYCSPSLPCLVWWLLAGCPSWWPEFSARAIQVEVVVEGVVVRHVFLPVHRLSLLPSIGHLGMGSGCDSTYGSKRVSPHRDFNVENSKWLYFRLTWMSVHSFLSRTVQCSKVLSAAIQYSKVLSPAV
jgi:hypothetical protein